MKKLRLRGYSASGAMLPCMRGCLPFCLVDGLRHEVGCLGGFNGRPGCSASYIVCVPTIAGTGVRSSAGRCVFQGRLSDLHLGQT